MVSFSLIATLAFVGLASAASAPTTKDSPKEASYVATYNTPNAGGTFNFTTSEDGIVAFDLLLSKVPKEGGPFFYYIHESSIPADGTCTGAKGIFNPYDGSYPTGNSSIPESDVALGNFPNNGYVGGGLGSGFKGINPYWSLNPDNKAFIGNLSVVFQYANKTPIACANIVKREDAKNSTGVAGTAKSGASKMAGVAAVLPLAAGAAALLI